MTKFLFKKAQGPDEEQKQDPSSLVQEVAPGISQELGRTTGVTPGNPDGAVLPKDKEPKPEIFAPPPFQPSNFELGNDKVKRIIEQFAKIIDIKKITEIINGQEVSKILIELLFINVDRNQYQQIISFLKQNDLLQEIKQSNPLKYGFITEIVVIQINQESFQYSGTLDNETKETIDSFIRESILFYLNEEEDFRQRYITNVRKLNQRIRSEILDNAKARMNFRLNINNTIRNIQECIDIAIENIKARLRDLNESKHKYLEKYNDFLNEQQEEGKQRPQFISLNKLGTLQSLLIAEYPNKNNYSLSILNIYLSSLYLLCLGDTNIMKAHIGYWKETSNNKEELFNTILSCIEAIEEMKKRKRKTIDLNKIITTTSNIKKNKFKNKFATSSEIESKQKVKSELDIVEDISEVFNKQENPETWAEISEEEKEEEGKLSIEICTILDKFKAQGGILPIISTSIPNTQIIRRVNRYTGVFNPDKSKGIVTYNQGKIAIPQNIKDPNVLFLMSSLNGQIIDYNRDISLLEETKGKLNEIAKINKELPRGGKQAILTEQDKLEKLTNAIKELYQNQKQYFKQEKRNPIIPKKNQDGATSYRINLTYEFGRSSKIYIYTLCLYIFEAFAAMLAYLRGENVTPQSVLKEIYEIKDEEKISSKNKKIKLLLKIAEKLDNIEQYKFSDIFMQKIQKQFIIK